jgi:fumarate hydratase, class II
MPDVRIESDSMGDMPVPAAALWGASTQRAVINFPVSGYRFGRAFIRALGLIKSAAAQVNMELGRLEKNRALLIIKAADEVAEGKLDAQFVVDVFQTGSGTSTNMNANEVIANRAIQLAKGKVGSKNPVHPNDHVNLGQSSNDVIPSAMHVAAAILITEELLPALAKLQAALEKKARAFDDIVKIGRTHLNDATPIRLGQEFSGYAAQAAKSGERMRSALASLRELAIGGTAVGTGVNTHPEFGRRVCVALSKRTGIQFIEAKNHFEAQAAKDAVVETAGALKTVAVSLAKIANDVRLMGSGPRCGLGELRLPAAQPGSSIMPGKINPVMCESLIQAAAQAVGADAAVTWAAAMGSTLDLNAAMPVMAHQLLEAVRILAAACGNFASRCVDGLEADKERCASMIERSLALATALAPAIGYDRAAALAKKALAEGKTIREVAAAEKVLSAKELDRLLDAESMTRPSGEGISNL